MSADILRRAAAGIRNDATEIPDRTVVHNRVNGVWLNSAYYLTTTPAFALAVADWLDDVAERHQRAESYVVAEQTIGDEADDEAAFLRRVELGSESISEGSWVENAIEDDDGNIVASVDPPESCCSHRPQDGIWPCPEVMPALADARAYLGAEPCATPCPPCGTHADCWRTGA